MTQPQAPLTYRDAGVDIDAGDALVDRIKPMAARTMREGVLAGIGGFGAGGGGASCFCALDGGLTPEKGRVTVGT